VRLNELADAKGNLVLPSRQDVKVTQSLKDAELRAADERVQALADFGRRFRIFRSVQEERRTNNGCCHSTKVFTDNPTEYRAQWARGAVIGASHAAPKAF
jgi:hypothetical protein